MFWCHDCSQPPAHSTTGWIHLLLKPLKSPHRPEALRPICLQHPMNKILTGLHCQLLRQIVLPQICRMPLYAYLPDRSTKDCLLIISDRSVICARGITKMLHRKVCGVGGLQVSLDLGKAFDAVSRNHVLKALEVFDMNPDLRNLITSWLMPHEYCLPHKDLPGRIRASRGIKQGAKDAPLMWIVCIYLFCHELLANHDMEWIRNHVEIFADDLHFRWIINSIQDGLAALHDLNHLIFSLQTAGFRVNPKKSAAMMRLTGRQMAPFLKKWCSRPLTGPVLHLPDMNSIIPMVGKISYLGVVISYQIWENDTVARRIQAAQTCFHILRSWLTNIHHPLCLRLRLYRQCIIVSLFYGIFEMVLTRIGCLRIISLINNHHRIMIRSPVHITRENTNDFFGRLQIDPAWIMIRKHFERFQEHLSRRRVSLSDPAIFHAADDVIALTPDYPPCHVIVPGASADPCAQADVLKCAECHRSFAQAGPLKRRMREIHSVPCHIEDVFSGLRDTTNGYPTYSHCARSFTDMYRLRDRINRRACLQFNPAKDCIAPICDRPDLRMHLRYKSIPGLLWNQSLMAELANHCAYCHSAISSCAIRKHYTDAYPHLDGFAKHARDQIHGLANLGSGKGICVLCQQSCRDVRNHACGVLYQLSVLMGQTYDPEHFPCMSVMMRSSLPANTSPHEPDVDSPATASKVLESDGSIAMQVDFDAQATSLPAPTSSCLHTCPSCHLSFLSSHGLAVHATQCQSMLTHQSPSE